MPCADPIPAYRPGIGGPLKFQQPKDGRAYTPIHIPCGYCILCREEQARQWAVRITHEAQAHKENSFVTLTYSDEHLPEHRSLNYEHLQKFWKRLRKSLGTLRYYAVGEYGDKSLRPHYHAVIFGQAFTKNRIIIRTEPHLLWTSPTLENHWGLGTVSVGALTFQTARYTASYVTKKLRSKQQYVRIDETTGELVPLVQPRPFMSRNIAKNWWNQYGKYVEDHDFVVINGQRQKPPKAYDRWLTEKDKEKMEEIKKERMQHAKKQTSEQSHARAKNAHARVNQKSHAI